MSASAPDADFVPGYFNCDEVTPRCPVEATIYGDYFTLGACLFFTILYGVLLLVQVPVGYMSKAWSFVGWLFVGAALEFVGYLCRSIMSQNPWIFPAFVVQNLFLILGPTCLGAALACTCKHIVTHYGAEHCILKARLIPWLFVGSDFVALLIQCLGGGLASTSASGGNQSLTDIADALLVAGVAFSAVTMAVEALLMLHFFYRYKKAKASKQSSAYANLASQTDKAESRRFTLFCYAIAVGFLTIIIRCIYRIPEMASGWGSDLMQNETTFLVLDGAMIAIATTAMTVFHPKWFFPILGSKAESVPRDQSADQIQLVETKHSGQSV